MLTVFVKPNALHCASIYSLDLASEKIYDIISLGSTESILSWSSQPAKARYEIILILKMLSFGILDDLHFSYGPVHTKLGESLDTSVRELVNVFRKQYVKGCNYCLNKDHGHEMIDESGYFDNEFFMKEDYYISLIVQSIDQTSYFVYNGYNKYYVIAFALNHKTFKIHSKDCEPKTIDWNS